MEQCSRVDGYVDTCLRISDPSPLPRFGQFASGFGVFLVFCSTVASVRTDLDNVVRAAKETQRPVINRLAGDLGLTL